MVILCDENGSIMRLLRDDFHLTSPVSTGAPLADLVEPAERGKLADFLRELKVRSVAYDWKIGVLAGNITSPLHFAGSRIDHGLLLVVASSRKALADVNEAMMLNNNEQTNGVRTALKEISLHRGVPEGSNSRYNELSRLNNELANLQREVVRKNVELKEQTIRLRHLAVELASVEQRERKRLAALLHDNLQQLLAAASMQIARVGFRRDDGAANAALERATKWIGEAAEAARDLAIQLRPPTLYEDGLIPALHWLASEMNERHQLKVDVDCETFSLALSDDIKALLFECVREALFNTVKYAGVDRAKVTVREELGCLRITVADLGCGFDVAMLARSGKRAGFGLFSIRERLAALGGNVTVESAPGEGTRVDMKVPITDKVSGEETNPRQDRGGGENGTLTHTLVLEDEQNPVSPDQRVRVLVVDDHAMVREGIANIISRDRRLIASDQAADGIAAIEAMEKRPPPHVVLMDLNMPRMNGIEAMREIHRRWPAIPVIGLSVQDDEATAKAMRRAGATTFVSKSGNSDRIVAAILSVVNAENPTCR